jgi:hypothetical protein
MGNAIRIILYSGLGIFALAGGSGVAGAQSAPTGLTIQKNVAVGSKHCDVVSWTDANGKPRSVSLVRADGDPGYSGGYVEQYSYYIDNTQKTGKSDETQAFVSGLGCAVNHHSSASSSKANSTGATTGFVFEGANHCVWRFSTPAYSGAGAAAGSTVSVKLTIDWIISQGRNDVLWAVSFDATGQPTFDWDSRGPYFQFDWDGDGHFYDGAISGIRWGDKYKFKTTNYTAATSDWDYTQPNVVPYMTTWKNASIGDLEAGVVQTQPWTQQDAGGYWWANTAWGQTSATMPLSSPAMPTKGMPVNWDCPFQINAYEGYAGEKLAWGTNFGFVGDAAYTRLGYDAPPTPGTPHQGYSTYIILNKWSQGLTDAMISSMEAVQSTTLTATTGSVVTSGPRHLNLSGTSNYQPAGWDHVYGAWTLTAGASNVVAFNVNVGSGTLVRPLFVVNNYTAATPPASLSLGGTALTSGTDYSASVDAANQRLWITLNRNLSGATNALATGSVASPPGPTPPPGGTPPPATTPSNTQNDGGKGGGKCGCGTAGDASSFLASGGAAALALLILSRRAASNEGF